MLRAILIGGSLAVMASGPALAQTTSFAFDQAAYVTCREAQALQPNARRALATFLAEHVARKHGVVIPESEMGAQIGYLVRGGCTLAPDSYLFTVIDRAVRAEMANLPKR
ncbi:hypothetical protein [Reyranella sp.]|uniref:hypothetical protein n=1 Tax=Reyranella sp. TaxID=1929291 RepID=UPI0037849223